MSIEKKSLISTLKTTKKANVAKGDLSHAGSQTSSVKSAVLIKAASVRSTAKAATFKTGKMPARLAGKKSLG
jgi:hypothetical protein